MDGQMLQFWLQALCFRTVGCLTLPTAEVGNELGYQLLPKLQMAEVWVYIELIIKVTNSKCCSAKTKRLTGHYKKRGRKKGADSRRTGAKLN